MFKLNDVSAHRDSALQKEDEKTTSPKMRKRHVREYLLDVFVVLAMGALLFWGISTQFPNRFNDVTRYQCYANVFWKGTPGLASLPATQCAFLSANSSASLVQKMKARGFPASVIRLVEAQSTTQPLHALPPEYPLLTILPDTLGLVAPEQWYQVAFALWMALIAGVIYFVLKHYRSTGAAIAFAIYLVIGNWATAEGRFDLIPAGLTLGAVILAGKAKWKWAFSLLALATLFKFYPAILLLPFLIAQQMQSREKWNSWHRWSALGVFLAICAGVTLVSLLLNVADTLSPLSYFVNRPTEIESLQASLLWLGHFVGYPTKEAFTYQSLNMLSPLSSKVSLLGSLCLGAGLLYIAWLQWRGRLDIDWACLLTLLIVVITGKVFSPQYLMWVTPLVAYVGKSNWRWLVSWGIVGALTTFIFPYMFDHYVIDKYFPVFVVRNGLIVIIVLALLYHVTRVSRPARRTPVKAI
jgi:Glycosyltransferase family 87